MILELSASVPISPGMLPSQGTSDTARFVVQKWEEWRRQLQESVAIGLRGKGAFDDLYQVYEDCREADWDGYHALPVSEGAYRQAYRLLDALPLGTPAPTCGAEPDGHVTLEWHRSPLRTLSVSVSPEAELHYAALLGARRVYGTDPFYGEAPRSITELIQQVMAA